MSKAEIIEELPQGGGAPTAEEKALLDQALEEYRRNPNAGRPWREAMNGLKHSLAAPEIPK